MPHTVGAIAVVIGRVVTGLVASASFYLAFFLYENEDGIWQSRVDGFWVLVSDRVKTTNNRATATINILADLMRAMSDWIFGKKLFSLHAVAVSLNFSVAISYLACIVWFFNVPVVGPDDKRVPSLLSQHPAILLNGIPLCLLLLLNIRYRKQWLDTVVFVVMFVIPAATGLVGALFAQGWLAPDTAGATFGYLLVGVFASMIVSVLSDFLGIVVVRRVFASIASASSITRITLGIIYLICVIFVIEAIPWYVIHINHVSAFEDSHELVIFGSTMIMYYNMTTVFYCLLPICILILLMIDRLIWPVISRTIYPLSRFAIAKNKVVLVSVGTVCAAFAVNPEKVGLKDLLKLLT